jgi:phenylpyruvate tautomerase PptA (4-oxalocrotonate tautomerase family)
MPFTRISLLEGKDARYVKTLADRVHQALVEGFDTPEADRFQAIHQHRPGELIYDENYMDGPRSADYVLISITAGRPRPPKVKQALYSKLVHLLGESPGVRPQDIMVIINTTQSDEWSFGSGRSIIKDE